VLATDATPAEAPALYADRRAQVVRQLGGRGGVVIWDADGVSAPAVPGFAPNARQVVVKLKPGERPSAALREFAGSVFGTVRSGPEALAAAELGDGKPAGTADAGVGLKAHLHQPGDGPTAVVVELAYERGSVIPAQPGEVLGPAPGPAGGNRTLHGLRITDADGKPFAASPVGVMNRLDPNGRQMLVSLRLNLTPTEKGQGDPAAVTFWGSYSKPVEVPFALKDVPLGGGKK
jgi:hypothetical protein